MCRSIKTLFNFQPAATDEEIRAAALQFVRKVSGYQKPPHGNIAAFMNAVNDIAATSRTLLESLETSGAPKNRKNEAAKARLRAAPRVGSQKKKRRPQG